MSKKINCVVRSLALFLFFTALSAQISAQNAEADLLEIADSTAAFTEKGGSPILGFSDQEVRERLQQLNGSIPVAITPAVRSYLNTYIHRKTEKTRKMLGKRLTYFPIFEQKAKEYGLPADIKYLSVVESALNPVAVSRVGATGLWQFMPATGKDYDLRQTGQVDERSDPVKSTEAAMRYLRDLYAQFGDWALALAAYNSGPTRVNNAIKRGHSRNFWQIQRYLPAETANYVPAFIAASYICNYFQIHNIEAENPDLDEQLTSYIRIWEGLSFQSIADATGIEYELVKQLNPSYKRDYIPADMGGSYVVLPTRVMPAFAKYMSGLSTQHNYVADFVHGATADDGGDPRYAVSVYKIDNIDHVDRIGASIGANGEHLKTWNKLESSWVAPGTLLKVWRPVSTLKHQSLRIEPPAAKPQKKTNPAPQATAPPPQNEAQAETKIEAKPNASPVEKDKPRPAAEKEPAPKSKQFQWHTVRRNETLDDIARLYGVTTDFIRKANKIESLKVGTRLKVKEL